MLFKNTWRAYGRAIKIDGHFPGH